MRDRRGHGIQAYLSQTDDDEMMPSKGDYTPTAEDGNNVSTECIKSGQVTDGKAQEQFAWKTAERSGSGEDIRSTLEKPPLSKMDGRVARGKGKNVPLNFRVTAPLKQRFLNMAAKHDITMIQVLDMAMEALEAAEKRKK